MSVENFTDNIPPTKDPAFTEPVAHGNSANGLIISIVVVVLLCCCGGIIGYLAVQYCGKKAGIDDRKGGGKCREGGGKDGKGGGKENLKMSTTKISRSVKQKHKGTSSSTRVKRHSSSKQRRSMMVKASGSMKPSYLKRNLNAATNKKRSTSTAKKRLSRSLTMSKKKVNAAPPASPTPTPKQPKLVKMNTALKPPDYSKIDQAISQGAKKLKSRSRSRSNTQPLKG